MRKHSLTTETVQEAVEELLAQAAEAGKAATVTALANRLGVKRQTLYRDLDPAALTSFHGPPHDALANHDHPGIRLATARRLPDSAGRRTNSRATCTSAKTTSAV